MIFLKLLWDYLSKANNNRTKRLLQWQKTKAKHFPQLCFCRGKKIKLLYQYFTSLTRWISIINFLHSFIKIRSSHHVWNHCLPNNLLKVKFLSCHKMKKVLLFSQKFHKVNSDKLNLEIQYSSLLCASNNKNDKTTEKWKDKDWEKIKELSSLRANIVVVIVFMRKIKGFILFYSTI